MNRTLKGRPMPSLMTTLCDLLAFVSRRDDDTRQTLPDTDDRPKRQRAPWSASRRRRYPFR